MVSFTMPAMPASSSGSAYTQHVPPQREVRVAPAPGELRQQQDSVTALATRLLR